MRGQRESAAPFDAIAVHFHEKTKVPLKQHIRWILEVAGCEEAAEFLICRHELGLTDNHGLHRDGIAETVLLSMIRCLQNQMQHDIADFRQRLLDATKPIHQKLPPKGKHEIVSADWEKQKALIIEADNQRRQEQEATRQRVRAAPKPAPIQLHRRRLERSLDATPMEPATATPPKTYSRKAKGECGERIGRKIDRLVAAIKAEPTPAEIEHERTCVSVCCAPVTDQSSVDPPAPAFGGGVERAPDDSADGGIGFSNDATAWDAFSGRNQCVNEITNLLQTLDEEPRLRSSAMLRSLSRVREQLEAMPEQTGLDAPVCIPLQDTLVLLTQAMSRLR
ncbi:hypothetical protein [Synechococcus sp. MIT S9507]|uniref:hypothetical protein n=1 Tax=Synechococcus sp. MIT S9507 TaxID=3082544 RepID=UPI0039B60DBA